MLPEYLDRSFMIYLRDGVEFINLLHSDSVQLILTKLPKTTNSFKKTFTHMQAVEVCAAMADASVRVLAPNGILAINLELHNISGVAAAISKRTHLQHGGTVINPDDEKNAVVVFYKGKLNTYTENFFATAHFGLNIIESFILKYTEQGDVVVDPFCGSGNVMETAVVAGRIAIVNDQDPQAVEDTINRYKDRCAK